ncbi:hypothetical protein FRC03_000279 [Tulasnella sp. 419]|nr:hypothetical protein FRC03_000279 [Tulasnella sp. 419]
MSTSTDHDHPAQSEYTSQDINQAQVPTDLTSTNESQHLRGEAEGASTPITTVTESAQDHLENYPPVRSQLASAISRLPNEIISDIFIHLLYSIPLDNTSKHYKCLVSLRHVCSRFRSITDATPSLWARICETDIRRKSLERTAMLLKKSRSTLLDIRIDVGVTPNDNPYYSWSVFNLILEHSQRWNTFQCCYTNRRNFPLLSFLSNLAQHQVPHLRKFVIQKPYNEGSMLSEARVDLEWGLAPCLQHLDISPILISWDSSFLSGLTFLRINAWDGVRPPTSEQYLKVLSSCPRLKELHLKGRDHSTRRDWMGAEFHSPITLSELDTLSLESLHATTILSILSSIEADPKVIHIIFPGSAKHRWEEVIHETLLHPASGHLLTRFTSSPRTIKFVQDSESNPIQAWIYINEGPAYCFTCGISASAREWNGSMPLYHTLFQPPARATLTALHFDAQSSFSLENFDYCQLFGDLVGLRELTLSGRSLNLRGITRPLSEQDPSSSSSTTWLCPQLSKLELSDAWFDIEDLWLFLDTRYGAANPPTRLLRLSVQQSLRYTSVDNVPMDIACKIADLVGSEVFVWDGYTLSQNGERKWTR